MLLKCKQWLASHRYAAMVWAVCIGFILVCAAAIRHEYFFVPYSVFMLLALYVLCFHTEKFFYLIWLIIPFSVELREMFPKISYSFSIPSELMLVALMALFLCGILLHRNYPRDCASHGVSQLLYFYLFWIFLTSITSTIPIVSFKFLMAKLWFVTVAYFFFLLLLKKDIHKASTALLCYGFALAVVVMITTYKHITLGDVRKVAYWVMSPYYNDHTAYGAVLAFFVPVLSLMPFVKELPVWKKYLSWLLLVPVMSGLYLSFSRAAWLSVILAMGVAVIILLGIRLRTVLLSVFAVMVLAVGFQHEIVRILSRNSTESSTGNLAEHIQSMSNITTDASNVERFNRWSAAVDMFKDKPVFGFGPGTYQFNYASYQNPKFRTIISTNAGDGGNAHSEYLGPLSETGLLGMLIVITLVLMVLVKGINVYRYAKDHDIRIYALMSTLSLITYFLHGILNNFLDTEKLAIPVFGAMAVIVVCDIKYKKVSKSMSSLDSARKTC
ncbi:MAG: O-antigen ligase family protein [Bacteroidales bacterium]|nr:O-antigen ligase family protein [Bacteroidales bacterium]